MTTTDRQRGRVPFDWPAPGSYTVSEPEDPDYNRMKPAGENKYGPFEVKSESVFPTTTS